LAGGRYFEHEYAAQTGVSGDVAVSDFLTTLAQNALGLATTVQPRLASRFENNISEEAGEIETMTSRPTLVENSSPQMQVPQFIHHEEQRDTLPLQQQDRVLHEPTSERMLTHETTHEVTRELEAPRLVSPITQTQVINNVSVVKPSLTRKPEIPRLELPTLHELREKENLHHSSTLERSSKTTETLVKENRVSVIEQELVKPQFPETPLLRLAPTPTLFKPEVTPAQVPTPTVQVTIGRLEIRTPPQQKTVQQPSRPTGVMSLEEYRSKRGLQ
jgi:hypothetical protein